MARVYGIHELLLRPTVSKEEFEKFILEELPNLPQPAGTRTYVLKGNRGLLAGGYIAVYEFESEERQDELWPNTFYSEEMRRIGEHPGWKRWHAFFEHTMYTDWVEMGGGARG